MAADAERSTSLTRTTADAPGAVAILQLTGPEASAVVQQLTGRCPTRRARLVKFEDIDEGLMVGLHDGWCQLMPHGGPRVVQRLTDRLIELGAQWREPTAGTLYPEARCELEAMALRAMSEAASPAAIDRLLVQTARWTWLLEADSDDAAWQAIVERSRTLNCLIYPPTVALVGRANVGKSTLTNLIAGRAASITADLPGTTRDWVAGLADLDVPSVGEVVVRWFDTPGLRATDDAIERRAIELARAALQETAVLMAMRDPQQDWPDADALPRTPDLWVLNKADQLPADQQLGDGEVGRSPDAPLPISAIRDNGADGLAALIGERLDLPDVAVADGPWAFDPMLMKIAIDRDRDRLRGLLAELPTDVEPRTLKGHEEDDQ